MRPVNVPDAEIGKVHNPITNLDPGTAGVGCHTAISLPVQGR